MNSSTASNDGQNCEYEANIEILRGIPFFYEMPLEALRAMALLCRQMKYKDGEVLFRQGEQDAHAYSIISGTAELVREDEDGETVASHLGEGRFIGALTLLGDVKRLFTLRAKGPLTCLVIPRRKVLDDLARSERFAQGFFKALARSVVQWEERLLAGCDPEAMNEDAVGVSLL